MEFARLPYGRDMSVTDGAVFWRNLRDDGFLFRALSLRHFILAAPMLDFGLIVMITTLVYMVMVYIGANPILSYLSGAAAVSLICHCYLLQGHFYPINVPLTEARARRSITLRFSLVFAAMMAMVAAIDQRVLPLRIWLVTFYGGLIVGLAVGHPVVAVLIRSSKSLGDKSLGDIARNLVVIVSEATNRLMECFKTPDFGFRIAGAFENQTGKQNTKAVAGFGKLAGRRLSMASPSPGLFRPKWESHINRAFNTTKFRTMILNSAADTRRPGAAITAC